MGPDQVSGDAYDAVANAAVEPAEVAPAVEPDLAPAADSSPEGPPSWFSPYAETMDRLNSLLSQPLDDDDYQSEEPQIDASQIDFSDPQQASWYVNAMVQQGIQNAMGNYTPIIDSVAEERGRDIAERILSDMHTEVGGEFDHDLAIALYQGMSYDSNNNPDQVLREAGKIVADHDRQVGERAVEAYKASLQNVQAGLDQPTAGISSASETDRMPTGRDKYEIISENWNSRRNAAIPQ